MAERKINLGSGYDYRQGYLNVDAFKGGVADKRARASLLDLPHDTYDEICASHIIEHLGYAETLFTLANIYLLLKDGGRLVIKTPDVERSFSQFLSETDPEKKGAILCWIYGVEEPGMRHAFCFPKDLLKIVLEKSGFEIVSSECIGSDTLQPEIETIAQKKRTKTFDRRNRLLNAFRKQRKIKLRQANYILFEEVIEAFVRAGSKGDVRKIVEEFQYQCPRLLLFLIGKGAYVDKDIKAGLRKICRFDPFAIAEKEGIGDYDKALCAFERAIRTGKGAISSRNKHRPDFFTPAEFDEFLDRRRALGLKKGIFTEVRAEEKTPPAEGQGDMYAPDCAVLEITLACNCRCLHCGGSAGYERKGELTINEIRAIARDLRKIGFGRVALIGGETFLRPDWQKIAKVCQGEGLIITYVSNGSLFPHKPKLVRQVVQTRPQVVGLSLDGGRAETHDHIRGRKGSFDEVIESIGILQKKGIDVSVISTIHRLNIKELPLIRDLLRGRNVAWQIQVATDKGCRFNKGWLLSADEYVEVAKFVHENAAAIPVEELALAGADDLGYFSSSYPLCSINGEHWDGCKAGRSNIGIQSNGNVKGCLSLSDDYIEGNIREKSLYDIWNDPKAFSYTRNFDVKLLRGACAKCDMGRWCKGGCIDFAHSISGHAFENSYCLHARGL